MAQDDPLLAKFRHVHEIIPDNYGGGVGHDVNDYLAKGWVFLNSGVHTGPSDHGPSSTVNYVVGWVGEGEPEMPPGP